MITLYQTGTSALELAESETHAPRSGPCVGHAAHCATTYLEGTHISSSSDRYFSSCVVRAVVPACTTTRTSHHLRQGTEPVTKVQVLLQDLSLEESTDVARCGTQDKASACPRARVGDSRTMVPVRPTAYATFRGGQAPQPFVLLGE